jgi:hypothetical protein
MLKYLQQLFRVFRGSAVTVFVPFSYVIKRAGAILHRWF